MKDELMKLLPDLKQAVEQGITYAGDLFSRAVEYYKMITYVWLSVSVVLLITSITYFVSTYRWVCKENDSGYPNSWDDRIPANLIFGILLPFSIVILICCITDLIKLNTIPELYILQMLAMNN